MIKKKNNLDPDQIIFSVGEVARAIGWKTKRMRRWLAGQVELKEVNGHYYVSREMLMEIPVIANHLLKMSTREDK